ncbi:MAG: LapA family protein [Candidatus Aminicenantes bacterium]|nr:LapA family protein [Candidatus Aminicenantes bacterium]
MKGKAVLILVLTGLLAILVVQNSRLAPVRLYFWSLYMPLFLLVLGVFAVGLVVGFLLAKVEKGRRRTGEAVEAAVPPGSSRSGGS